MISTDGLSRSFRTPDGGEFPAVRDIDLSVARGESVAVLGPNGAGKSTLMRMLSTLLPPTRGSARVAGFDVSSQSRFVREHIGYVGQGSGAGHHQRAVDELVTQGRIHGLSRAAARGRAAELLSLLQLEPLARRKTQAMSGGQRRRLDLALGLVNLPPLLFLDEPTTGLDPQSRGHLWDHVVRIRQKTGMTIVFTTHYLEEADHAADRVVVVDRGRIVADGPPELLKQRSAGHTVTLAVPDPVAARRLQALLATADRVRAATAHGTAVTAKVDDGRTALPALITAARDHGIDVVAAETRTPTLDDVFLELTGWSLREAGAFSTGEAGQSSGAQEDSA
ncbi:ATP-binding cassette domain-containing protein [Nocardiopsis algeriensis]|uniref:ABC-2 type transport system ATP-binding protein n=1 Tax=Nocardiopsis algeriensis TaxID=1478215 RepID=A0A841IR00_9ACTN|nr:ATP-binding cassette domain-containing protein [Nocardiopsis algeriensis]MBB6120542.1 ABC-2 type transport system ATP-binding protein [Nocardiopsis algeriensis]